MWDPQLDALPEAERASALAAVFYLKIAERNFRKLRLSPIKKSLEFDALVARVAGPDIGPKDAQDPRDLFAVAHCLRDSRTVVAGSPVRNGPYGDLFHRVLWGWGTVIDLLFQDRLGYAPAIDPVDTVPTPQLRLFLDSAVGRYADGLMNLPSATTPGDFPSTLESLSAHFQQGVPRLIEALEGQQPFVSSLQGADFILPYEQYLEMTHDEKLSARAVEAAPV